MDALWRKTAEAGIPFGIKKSMEPPMGLEPTTYALRVRCSTD